MERNEKIVDVLNDLIRINHDRIVGYEKGIEELKDGDADLKTLFNRYIQESRKYTDELTHEVSRLGGNAAEGTTNSGKIYRVWMDIKATFTGHDRTSALESCEYGEDAAQEAYDDALATDVDLPVHVRQLIANQKAELLESHNLIKKYRDLHQVISK